MWSWREGRLTYSCAGSRECEEKIKRRQDDVEKTLQKHYQGTKKRLMNILVFRLGPTERKHGSRRREANEELMLLRCKAGENAWNTVYKRTSESIMNGHWLKSQLQFFGHKEVNEQDRHAKTDRRKKSSKKTTNKMCRRSDFGMLQHSLLGWPRMEKNMTWRQKVTRWLCECMSTYTVSTHDH